MSFSFLWNIITNPRSTILGLVGTTSGGAAFLFIADAMHCDWTQLSTQTLSAAAAMLSAPTVIGAVMKDTKPNAGDAQNAKDGGNSF